MKMPLTSQKVSEELNQFSNSPRGLYIISQALTIASVALEDKEPSNSRDMVYLLEKYPMYPTLQAVKAQAKEKLEQVIKKRFEGDKNE